MWVAEGGRKQAAPTQWMFRMVTSECKAGAALSINAYIIKLYEIRMEAPVRCLRASVFFVAGNHLAQFVEITFFAWPSPLPVGSGEEAVLFQKLHL